MKVHELGNAGVAILESEIQRLQTDVEELRWQLRMVLEFYQTPSPSLLKQAGSRYAVLVEAWRLVRTAERVHSAPAVLWKYADHMPLCPARALTGACECGYEELLKEARDG